MLLGPTPDGQVATAAACPSGLFVPYKGIVESAPALTSGRAAQASNCVGRTP